MNKRIRQFSGSIKTSLTLKTKEYEITLKPHKNGYIQVFMYGPHNTKRQALTNLTNNLTEFEGKVACYHFLKIATTYSIGLTEEQSFEASHTNYASIFSAGYL